jgi:hypothetical protein
MPMLLQLLSPTSLLAARRFNVSTVGLAGVADVANVVEADEANEAGVVNVARVAGRGKAGTTPVE